MTINTNTDVFSVADFADSIKASAKSSRRGMRLNDETEKIIMPTDEDLPPPVAAGAAATPAHAKKSGKHKAASKAAGENHAPDEPPVDSFLDTLYGEAQKSFTAEFDSLKNELGQLASDAEGKSAVAAADTAATSAPASAPVMEDIYSSSAAHPVAFPAGKAAEKSASDSVFSVSMEHIGDDSPSDFTREIDQISSGGSVVSSVIRNNSVNIPQEYEDIDTNPGQKKKGKKKFLSGLIPGRYDSVGEIFRKCLLLVACLTMAVCIGILGNTYVLEPFLLNDYADVADPNEEEISKFNKENPNIQVKAESVSLITLYNTNSSFYGYLKIDGLGLKFPTVKGTNNEYYLARTFEREKSRFGCPFVNYKNSSPNSGGFDMNTSIFGHSMQNESKDKVFGPLREYRSVEGFRKAPLISLEMLRGHYYFKVYAVFISSANYDSGGYFFNYIFTQLSSEQAFMEYISEIDQRKLYSTGVDIRPSDKLLTLSTCCYDFTNARLVVVGRLVREGENTKVDTSLAKVNANPRYPNEYYTKKGIRNPYANASKWLPK